jgi:hypothetical protein
MRGKKRSIQKKTAAVVSILLMAALLITGTFAYFAGQSALNVFSGSAPKPTGGVGRDDYEPGHPGKQVYVENRGDTVLYTRVKLEEFMALNDVVIVGENGATKTPSTGWIVHKDAPDPTALGETVIAYGTNHEPDKTAHDHWQWTFGGSKVYLPAPDSAIANNESYNGSAYGDTTAYTEVDMGSNAALKKTPVGTVMTYQYWKDARSGQAGPYWVIDPEDGYIYWAQAIEPGGASGLLLAMVEGPQGADDDWETYYYAINVVFDFADEKDFGVMEDSAKEKGKEILDVAKEGAKPVIPATGVKIGGLPSGALVEGGSEAQLTATLVPSGATEQATFEWRSSNTDAVIVDENGKITPVGEGTADITVTATVNGKTFTDTVTLTVNAEAPGTLAVKTSEYLNPLDPNDLGPFYSSVVVFDAISTGKPEYDVNFMGTGTLPQCYGYYPLSIFLDDTSNVKVHSISGLPAGQGTIEVGAGIKLIRLNGLDYSNESCVIIKWLPEDNAVLTAMSAGPNSTMYADVTIKLEQTIGNKTQISDDITLRISFAGLFTATTN